MRVAIGIASSVLVILAASRANADETSSPVSNAQPSTPVERSAIAQPVDGAASATPDPEPPAASPPAPAVDAPPPSEPAKDTKPTPTPPPYSLPWQLRPVIAPTVIRSDSSIASYEDRQANGGLTFATGITGSYKIPGTGDKGAGLAIVGRLMAVSDSPPSAPATTPTPTPSTGGGLAVVNPLIGAAYAMKHGGGFRSNLFFGLTLPIGQGGGGAPDKGLANSRTKGINARAAMDNALFAVNDMALIPGVGFAYVGNNLTVQVEATLLHLVRTRGENVQVESSKTNFTTGIHVGYFFAPWISAGTDLRYQRWINAPLAVDRDATGATKDNLTVAFGPRFHFKVGSLWVRPGVAYWRGLDKPLAASTPNYHAFQIDVPVLF